jgi:putative transposase
MKRNRFTDEQIIGILKEHDGVAVADLCRKHGAPASTKWKAKFGGMDFSANALVALLCRIS